MSILTIQHTKRPIFRLLVKKISGTYQRPYSTEIPGIKGKQPKQDNANEKNIPGFVNEPIKFLGSQAEAWTAKKTRSGGSDDSLWYQPYVISVSLAVFLMYFCVLREESDIDQKLEGSLYDHVDGLEEVALTVNYKFNKEHGLDTKIQEQRLKELGISTEKITMN